MLNIAIPTVCSFTVKDKISLYTVVTPVYYAIPTTSDEAASLSVSFSYNKDVISKFRLLSSDIKYGSGYDNYLQVVHFDTWLDFKRIGLTLLDHHSFLRDNQIICVDDDANITAGITPVELDRVHTELLVKTLYKQYGEDTTEVYYFDIFHDEDISEYIDQLRLHIPQQHLQFLINI